MLVNLKQHELGKVMLDASAEAQRLGDRTVGTEHLTLALLADPVSPSAKALGVSLAEARKALQTLDFAALSAVGIDAVEPGPATAPRARIRLSPAQRPSSPACTRASGHARSPASTSSSSCWGGTAPTRRQSCWTRWASIEPRCTPSCSSPDPEKRGTSCATPSTTEVPQTERRQPSAVRNFAASGRGHHATDAAVLHYDGERRDHRGSR